MQIEERIAAIEAILFASGDPVETEKIALASGTEKETVPKLIQLLSDRYENIESALQIVKLNDSYQMVTQVKYAEFVKAAMETKRSAPLSQAAMEVLTIIAYNQPVTKGFVEHVRGVDSSSIVNSLLERGLLEEAGRLDVPGRPIAYSTSDHFLRCFQLTSLEELPPLPSRQEQVSFDEVPMAKD